MNNSDNGAQSTTYSRLMKSSKSDEYQTPLSFYKKLNKIFDFKIDPATTHDNPLGTDIFYSIENNGLKQKWNGNTFVNPPYSKSNKKMGKTTDITNWIYKMYYESIDNSVFDEEYMYVMLLPMKLDTSWAQNMIMGDFKDGSVLYLIKGRLKFVNPDLNKNEDPHFSGSMLWMRNTTDYEHEQLLNSIPGILIEDWREKGDV